METTEGNKLIAEFMGYVISESMESVCGMRGGKPMEITPFADLKYHESWDWLMPVVEKIENTYILTDKKPVVTVRIEGNDCMIERDAQHEMAFPQLKTHNIWEREKSKIEATWKAVIEFIQWLDINN